MVYNIKWIIPKLRNPTKLWNIASSITFVAVGIFSKFIIELLNKTRVHNKHILVGALNRKGNIPLITVSNHHSCFDDPGLWGSLNLKHLINRRRMRWSLAAQDICFTNVWYSYFFMLGKCIPVIRGEGVYQEAINFCLEKLASGDWVHVFPEGKVNMLKENMRLKWGVGRLIMESPITPLVIPIYHLGMDKVLPNDPPYIIKAGKKVTMYYGDPIDFSGMVADLRANNATEMDARKAITDRIQDELLRQSLRSCMQGFDNGVAVHAVTRSSQNLRRIMGSNTVHEVSVRNDRDIENLKAPDSNRRMVAYDKKELEFKCTETNKF